MTRNIGAKSRGPIRVTLPVSVAFDLEKFERALANVSHVVECKTRHSRRRREFSQVREFVIDPASLEVREVAYSQ